MPSADVWRGRAATLRAMALLCRARLMVAALPFHRWRRTLGFAAASAGPGALTSARRAAAQVERAAVRLPVRLKCLPRAMALSWILRRKRIGHSVVIAVRPPSMRDSPDALHAWVEVEGVTVIGDLAGPWIETCRLGP